MINLKWCQKSGLNIIHKWTKSETIAVRRSAPRGGEDRWQERLRTSEARKWNSSRAEDPRGRSLLQDAANPHRNHDGHHPAAACGGRLRPRLFIYLLKSDISPLTFQSLLVVGHAHWPKGPSHRHVQVSGRRRTERQHDGQRSAHRSSPHRWATAPRWLCSFFTGSSALPANRSCCLGRYYSRVSADALPAAEQRYGHASTEGQAVPEHDG